ncbi:MAG: hypothetical protein ACOY3I_02305 [Verrucomicrobiota bacterium]
MKVFDPKRLASLDKMGRVLIQTSEILIQKGENWKAFREKVCEHDGEVAKCLERVIISSDARPLDEISKLIARYLNDLMPLRGNLIKESGGLLTRFFSRDAIGEMLNKEGNSVRTSLRKKTSMENKTLHGSILKLKDIIPHIRKRDKRLFGAIQHAMDCLTEIEEQRSETKDQIDASRIGQLLRRAGKSLSAIRKLEEKRIPSLSVC